MRGKNTIIINGRAYDAVSGRPASIEDHQATTLKKTHSPVAPHASKVISDFGPVQSGSLARRPASLRKAVSKKPTTVRQVHKAHAIHHKPDRSHTLLRHATKKPQSAHIIAGGTEPERSPMISRFAPHPVISTPKIHPEVDHTVRKLVRTEVKAPSQPTPIKHFSPADKSRQLKEHLIKERLSEVDLNKRPQQRKGLKKLISKPRAMHVATMCLALVMLGGYLTYVNMPNLSVQVAAARSGVAASYPEYRPDGYRFNGPVAYSPGEVTLRFKSNTGAMGYSVKQRASNWDSQAVLDNVVAKASASYLTYSEQGLTIYTYSNKAAWVNGGVLYTIDGDAPLSSEQVLRIAASM